MKLFFIMLVPKGKSPLGLTCNDITHLIQSWYRQFGPIIYEYSNSLLLLLLHMSWICDDANDGEKFS